MGLRYKQGCHCWHHRLRPEGIGRRCLCWLAGCGREVCIWVRASRACFLYWLALVNVVFVGSTTFASVESVKAASDVYAPVSGSIVEVNTKLQDDPALVNSGAEAEGWFAKIKVRARGGCRSPPCIRFANSNFFDVRAKRSYQTRRSSAH
jgi:hypothetical protein